ncbi:MAG: hypothetical protein JSS65_00545 [Armatimonadetes bacterium]|nr:hypothetical protein [Armatimonadota bacterium]
MAKRAPLLVMAIGLALSGCEQSATTASPDEDKKIRDGFSRSLTPEEIGKMGGGKKDTSAGVESPKKK